MRVLLAAVFGFAVVAGSAVADEATPAAEGAAAATPEKTVCQLIDEAAAAYKVPIEFFTRLIWRESRFAPDAVSPKGARGIAQFMPGTAAIRGLADPFDAPSAIAASAHYLRDLADGFGNLGLAAAAYNAGEDRVSDWLGGSGRLPSETLDYVLFVTGRTAEDWKGDTDTVEEAPAQPVAAAAADPAPAAKSTGCTEIAALLSKPGAGSAMIAGMSSAPWAPWGVQVAGGFSRARALASYTALQKRYASVLADKAPLVMSSQIRSRGRAPLYQVRVPAQTQKEADGLCARLHAAGGACVVFKNRP
jgi:hypothetical protein